MPAIGTGQKATRRRLLIAVLLSAAATAAASLPNPAWAGSFQVVACDAIYGNAILSQFRSSDSYMVTQSCPKGGAGSGLNAATAATGGLAPPFSAAGWTVTAPSGAALGRLSFSRYVQRASESWTVGMSADSGPGTPGVFLDGFTASDGTGAHDSRGWQPRSVNLGGRTRVSAGVQCGNQSGCGTLAGDVRARYSIADVNLEVIDATAPTVALGGPVAMGAWVGRQQSLGVAATDNVGIRTLIVSAAGERRLPIVGRTGDPEGEGGVSMGCLTDRVKPCPDVQDSYPIDLSVLADGAHVLDVTAIDAAVNAAAARTRINVDNTPPSGPIALVVGGGEGWRNANRFDLSWRNPEERFSPLVAARYEICRAVDGGGCVTGRQAAPNIAALKDVAVPGVGEWRIRVALEDQAGNVAFANAADAMLRFDDVAPGGVAFAALDPNDPTRLTATGTDQLSGLAGGQIVYRQVGSSGPWTALPTALDGGALVARIDDRKLRSATYELKVTALDGAGNATVSDRRVDGAKAELTTPLRIPMRVRLATRPVIVSKLVCRVKRVRDRQGRLVKKRVCRQVAIKAPRPLRALRVPFGKRRRIFGLVTSREGKPLAGAQVVLRARARRLGAQTRRVGTVMTNSAGRFTYLLRGTQSRSLLAVYPGTATVGYAAARTELGVPAKLKFRAKPTSARNGQTTTFTGRLVGGPVPTGKLVALQVILRGEWRPFTTVRADSSGRFRAVYRFTGTNSTARYRFRAVAPREATYPYDTGASRPIGVLVRP